MDANGFSSKVHQETTKHNGLGVTNIGDGSMEADVVHSNQFEWNCYSGIGHDLL